MKVLNVQGRRKTGKTTTVTNIIRELCRRGYSVGSVKGIHIEGFTMDVASEDTGKHKAAGADPVTARCHDETNILFKGRRDLDEILRYYDNDWVVIESHVDLNCPNIVTGRSLRGDDAALEEQINDLTICCSGIISNEETSFTAVQAASEEFAEAEGCSRTRTFPVINSTTDIERLVDLIEAKTPERMFGFTREACHHCGFGCRLMTERIIQGLASERDCRYKAQEVRVLLNGEELSMVPFVMKIVEGTITGLLGQLNGYSQGDDIVIHIKGNRDK